jgi:hypothetical protein
VANNSKSTRVPQQKGEPSPGQPGSQTYNKPMAGRFDGKIPAAKQPAYVDNKSGKKPEAAVHTRSRGR